MPAPIGHRDKVIAAALTGAVVVVVGYASGIGLRTDASAATTPPAADTGRAARRACR